MKMKEVKFKAFDKIAGKIYDVGYIDFANEVVQVAMIKNGICYATYISPLKDVELLQYTGLKDKNGKEIYEGDILECTSELLTNFGKTKTGRYETTYKQVIWLTDSWGYRVLKSKYIVEGAERKGLEVAIKFGVVCGNIYENSELLEESE